jgi:hypothetical protein
VHKSLAGSVNNQAADQITCSIQLHYGRFKRHLGFKSLAGLVNNDLSCLAFATNYSLLIPFFFVLTFPFQ